MATAHRSDVRRSLRTRSEVGPACGVSAAPGDAAAGSRVGAQRDLTGPGRHAPPQIRSSARQRKARRGMAGYRSPDYEAQVARLVRARLRTRVARLADTGRARVVGVLSSTNRDAVISHATPPTPSAEHQSAHAGPAARQTPPARAPSAAPTVGSTRCVIECGSRAVTSSNSRGPSAPPQSTTLERSAPPICGRPPPQIRLRGPPSCSADLIVTVGRVLVTSHVSWGMLWQRDRRL